ncbi:syntaxin-61-like [Impatiens glandulifera]|uniref:syntaxin-61-like n=1 Tax=Impatiens glandulifera TaxID=253017 RepID=UPI001FB101D6|nr:syntaxin-61-like [Impatiens glandulifera]XP_047340396.1 syntaxin-61-like [Impatiens glandulifera]
MSSAQDPFYIVKEEIQESIDKLLSTFRQWEHIPLGNQEQQNLTKELLVGCESIVWQVDELDKAISVSARDPAWYGIDEKELDKRRRWTSTARIQVGNVKKTLLAGKELDGTRTSNLSGMRRELMRLPNSQQNERSTHQYTSANNNNDDLISSESDRQLLLIRQQDEELDALSASVERIGGVGLTIHEELLAQENIIGDLGMEMESTSNRLDFVQKKVGMVMKKAGAKGQMMMILFLFFLFIILFVLVFFT